jgi:hypothetical protein
VVSSCDQRMDCFKHRSHCLMLPSAPSTSRSQSWLLLSITDHEFVGVTIAQLECLVPTWVMFGQRLLKDSQNPFSTVAMVVVLFSVSYTHLRRYACKDHVSNFLSRLAFCWAELGFEHPSVCQFPSDAKALSFVASLPYSCVLLVFPAQPGQLP